MKGLSYNSFNPTLLMAARCSGGSTPLGGLMRKEKDIIITDELVLRNLIKQANNQGYKLRLYRPKSGKYEFCISGSSPYSGWPIKMGGTAGFLYDELLKILTKDF